MENFKDLHGQMSMLWLLSICCFSKKIETEFDVKFTAACPSVAESQIVVDYGAEIVKPALRGSTYLRLHPGKHSIVVTHPWCNYYPVDFVLEEDGSFIAVVNGTTIHTYPVPIKAEKNIDKESLTYLISPSTMITMAVFFFGIKYCMGWLKSPENMERMKKYQEDIQRQLEEAKRQQEQNK